MYIYLLNLAIQLSIIPLYFYYNNNKDYYCSCKKLPILFPLAKSSANLVAINTGLLIFSLVKFYRKYIYIPVKYKKIHYIIICNIFFWSLLHSIIHIINYNIVNVNIFTNNTGITGIILILLFLLIILGALPIIRLNYFNYFILNHNLLFYTYILIFYIHQMFCFTKILFKSKKCPLLLSWIIITPTLLLYIIENIYKYTYYQNVAITYENEDIFKISLNLPKNSEGTIVWLCCPSINIYEFHPFAACYSNTIYCKIRGDWTAKLCSYKNVKMFVFGGIKVYPKNEKMILDLYNNKSIIISSGIGITIFVHLFELLSKCKTIFDLKIVIIVKSYKEIEWIIDSYIFDILRLKNIDIQFFFTDNTIITCPLFRFDYTYNRPNLKNIINDTYLNTIITKDSKINVYYAGNKYLYKDLKNIIKKYKKINLFNINYF